jgi:hypothetical protein
MCQAWPKPAPPVLKPELGMGSGISRLREAVQEFALPALPFVSLP